MQRACKIKHKTTIDLIDASQGVTKLFATIQVALHEFHPKGVVLHQLTQHKVCLSFVAEHGANFRI